MNNNKHTFSLGFILESQKVSILSSNITEEPAAGAVSKVEQGLKVDCVLGVQRSTSQVVLALVRYEDKQYELVPT